MLDLLSYLRRLKTPARRTPAADDEAINLETIGGEINGTYLDIASVSSPAPKEHSKAADTEAAGASSRTQSRSPR